MHLPPVNDASGSRHLYLLVHQCQVHNDSVTTLAELQSFAINLDIKANAAVRGCKYCVCDVPSLALQRQ